MSWTGTTFEIEAIDRMYLNVYQPLLQYPRGAAGFFHFHRGHQFASSALMAPMTKAFVTAMHEFVDRHGLDLVHFAKDQRKDDITQQYLADHDGTERVLYVGRAQEKASVMRTERRYDRHTGASYAWLVKASALVNHFYVYCFDDNFGPFFIKFCSYFPYNAKLYLLTELQDGSSQLTWRVPALMATVPACVRVRRAASGSVRVGGASEWGAAGE
jgi:hypothetical protein